MERQVRRLSAPLFVWWDITYRCNLRCEYCYSSSGKADPDELTTQECHRVINDLGSNGIFYIFFLGGEPFMRPDFLELLEYCHRVGVETMLTTNGWFVTPKIAKETAKAGVTIARVSIDGATADVHDDIRGVPGSFDRAVQALHYFREAGVPVVGVSPTISRRNLHQVEDIVAMSLREGATEIRLNPVCVTGRASQSGSSLSGEDSEFLRVAYNKVKQLFGTRINIDAPEGIALDKHKSERCDAHTGPADMMGCGAGTVSLAISPLGEVFHCILYRKEVGNVRTSSFREIWETSPQLVEKRKFRGVCLDCVNRPLCSGVCPLIEDIGDDTRLALLEKTNGCAIPLK